MPVESDAKAGSPPQEKKEKKPGLWTLQLGKADEGEDEMFDSQPVEGGEANEKYVKVSSTERGESDQASQDSKEQVDDAVTRMV